MEEIAITNLSKIFYPTLSLNRLLGLTPKRRGAVRALDGIDMEVRKGELLTILGPNRSGKTTLIKILMGLILPTGGSIYIQGRELHKNFYSTKIVMNFVHSQERSFYWRLTARENLSFFGKFYNMSGSHLKKRIPYLLDLLEINEPDIRFQEYSSGMKQRLAIARGLLNDPAIIFMDEPLLSLDVAISHKIRHFIKQHLIIEGKKTIISTTHDIAEALAISDRIAILVDGKIQYRIETSALKGSPKENTMFVEGIYKTVTENRPKAII